MMKKFYSVFLRQSAHFVLCVLTLCPVFALSLTADDSDGDEDDVPEMSAAQASAAVSAPLKSDEGYQEMTRLFRALAIIRAHYVDADKVRYDHLVNSALKGLLRELDPFSSFENQESFQAIRNDSSGKFAGVGLSLSTKNGALEVVSVIPNAPADKAGVKNGDIILEVDGESTNQIGIPAAIRKLKGPVDSTVEVKVYRRSTDREMDFSIKRAVISVSTVRGVKMLDSETGYIQISQFSATTAGDLDKAIEKLKAEKMKALIIDLRGNPGGLLDAAIEVCSRFIRRGELILTVEGRDRSPGQVKRYGATECPKTLSMPLAILINGNSASASEIFAGCMQDHKRAIIIGMKSFGKGSVQSLIPFGKEAIRLTIAKYYTPSRKPIHGNGVMPDIPVPLSPAAEIALQQQAQLYPGELKPRIAKPIRDIQLERAMEILKGVRLFQQVRQAD